MCLRAALTLNVGEASVEHREVRIDLIKAVAHVDREDFHHLIRLGNHGGGSHRIDLVFRY
jgi:hypothetical protein